jgi:HD-like signal output (HDOD) protein
MNKHEIFREIAKQLKVGDLMFPTGVQVALKIQRALEDPECHINTAVSLIKAEPLLAASVISIANSVAYNRSGREITDLNIAVSMLGLGTIRSLAMSLVTRQMAGNSVSKEHQSLVNKLWAHSAEVASLSHAIARRVTHLDPETALFAGIIHDIGGFYMISRAKDFPELLEGDFAEWLEDGEVIVGREVLKKLQIPDSISQIIETFWDGYLAMPPVTFADTLRLAKELTPTPSPLYRLANAGAINEVSASIEMLIGEETLAAILKESSEEISSLNRALQN